ncbi:PREDICTED: putative inorganic phosphate cotransporter isoform X1 [Eufriesea mexicana]|uniref:putative inorganic phosphate cotransporter isoform X1 n=1 Tax=Eufriesea mexicana TaxID=516756 RepID=UPI00083C039D|nr:PREDICTED: putative inorganic phosphate cotransporter isoform X1 [Eufriesea mexicana]
MGSTVNSCANQRPATSNASGMASNRNVLGWLTCRQVLNIMVIIGFMLNYMLRVNITIAIVSMVIPSNDTLHSSDHDKSSDCFDSTITINVTSFDNGSTTLTSDSATSSIPYPPRHEEMNQSRYSWNEYQVNLVLGSFFWGYICTELPGGRLAEIIGPKRVFGYSMLVSSIVTLLTPLAADYSYITVVALRAILGFMLGATWPAMQPMTVRWIPPTERSKFVSNMMASSLGAAITLPLSGFLIAYIGWESVFYVTGTIGLVWSSAWFFFIFDSPAQHPRITIEERRYIEDSIGTTSTTKRLPVPWKNIFLSPCVWAIVFAHGCNVFGYFTAVNQLPTYMKYILNFNIKENGMLSSLPYVGKYVFAVTTSTVADYLFKTKKLSITTIRKLFTALAMLSPGLLMVVQANYGCDRATSVVIFTIALTINGAVTAGYLGNCLDIAPNFSGTIFGIMNTLGSLGGFVSNYMVGMITYKHQTYARWRIMFWILATIYCFGALIFLIFGNGQLQKWNNPKQSPEENKANVSNETDPEELVQLKDKAVP